MSNRLLRAIALSAALTATPAAVAAAEQATVVKTGNLVIAFNGGLSPTKLPRHKLTPISFDVSGKIETVDGTRPPALREFVIEADRNSAVDAKGVPTCTAGKLDAQDTKHAEAICSRSAIVGTGTTNVEVEFPEQKPFVAKSKLLAFNGGVEGGTTTIFIHAYLSAPVSAAVVITVKVSKHPNGRYGTRSVASIPKIAGGYGSVKEFDLKIDREFTSGGERQGYLLAKCPDGHLNERTTAVFSDGSELTGSFVRACTPKG